MHIDNTKIWSSDTYKWTKISLFIKWNQLCLSKLSILYVFILIKKSKENIYICVESDYEIVFLNSRWKMNST
jgi:hypothetical protein